MSRRTKRRRSKRRARKDREALKPRPLEPDTPVDWNRIEARYRLMKGRAVTLRYVLWGPRVEARSPEELETNTAIALARLAEREPKN